MGAVHLGFEVEGGVVELVAFAVFVDELADDAVEGVVVAFARRRRRGSGPGHR